MSIRFFADCSNEFQDGYMSCLEMVIDVLKGNKRRNIREIIPFFEEAFKLRRKGNGKEEYGEEV